MQDALGLDTAPLRIECFDVSHVQGTNVVASHGGVRGRAAAQVGVPPVRDPRRRRLGHREGGVQGGDVQWIHEAVRRRFARYLDERIDTGEEADDTEDDEGDPAAAPQRPSPVDPETGRPRKFAYPPNLVVVDGGAPQVAAAAAALAELGIERRRAVRAGQAAGGGLAARRGRAR